MLPPHHCHWQFHHLKQGCPSFFYQTAVLLFWRVLDLTADIWYTWTRPIVGGDNQKLAKLKSVQKTGGCVEKLKSVKKTRWTCQTEKQWGRQPSQREPRWERWRAFKCSFAQLLSEPRWGRWRAFKCTFAQLLSELYPNFYPRLRAF